MCVVKSPKVTTTAEKPKEPTVIRNPYLDGPSPMNKAQRAGRNAFRIERGGSQRPQPTPSTTPTPAGSPVVQPSVPFGGGGGGGLGPMYLSRVDIR